MNRDELGTALRALGVELQRRGVQGDLYVVGGAAMALAYDTRRSTRDIDAIFEPKLVIYEAAARVADELGLPADWLNDGVKGFLVGADPYEAPVLEFPGVRVQMASPQMLLALKVNAAMPESAWIAPIVPTSWSTLTPLRLVMVAILVSPLSAARLPRWGPRR